MTKTNTKREPTLRINETTAARDGQTQHRTRTSEKGKRNYRELGTAKAKGDAKNLTTAYPTPKALNDAPDSTDSAAALRPQFQVGCVWLDGGCAMNWERAPRNDPWWYPLYGETFTKKPANISRPWCRVKWDLGRFVRKS